jgi:phospholipase C
VKVLRARVRGGLLALLLAASAAAQPATPPHRALPPIRHVFVLVLENQSFATTFGKDSGAPYLARALPAQGALLTQYYAIGHASLANYVAMISGQAPNEATQLDCPVFSEFQPSAARANADGQLPGVGCVYPTAVRTLAGQLEAAGLTWKAYLEDMGNDPQREPAACAHVALDAPDRTASASIGDQYATKHNPFVYFHAIIDDHARCAASVVNLKALPHDLASPERTPNLSFIVPNLCNDGHDKPCVDGRGGGLHEIDAFLRHWVPLITAAPAFRADGLLVITFDESDARGSEGSSACCGERPLPGARYSPGFNGPGGGRIGALVLSPYVSGGTVSEVPYNHYALLRTIETIFALPYLGYAAQPELSVFGADVFRAPEEGAVPARGAAPQQPHPD